jgi:hypothetical protein
LTTHARARAGVVPNKENDMSKQHLDVVLRFWMDQLMGANDFMVASMPVDVVKAMCELAWPGRTFSVVEGTRFDKLNRIDPDGECYLCHMVDDATGETAAELHLRQPFGTKRPEEWTAAAG